MKLGQWLGLFGIAISFYILWQIRALLLLVFTAVVLATALNGLVRWFQRRLPLGRKWAVGLTFAVTLLAFILFFVLIVPPFIKQFQQVIELLPKGFSQMRTWLISLRTQLPPWVPELPTVPELVNRLQPLATQVFGNFFAFFNNTLGAVLQILFIVILTFLFLAEPHPYRQIFIRLFPSFYRRRVDGILSQCEVALGNWFGGVVISSTGVALLSGVGLTFLGVRLVFAHSLLAGLLNFIPNIGPALSVVFPVAIALLDSPGKAGWVVVIYFFIQQIESYALTPTIMAQQVSLMPAITLLAQIFFATTFGFLGLLLALPLTVVTRIWVEEVLVKDILDQWHSQDAPPLALVDGAADRQVVGLLSAGEQAGGAGDRAPTDPRPNTPENNNTLVTPTVSDSQGSDHDGTDTPTLPDGSSVSPSE